MKKNLIHVIYPDEATYSYVATNDMSVEDNLERVFAEWNHGSGMECEMFINPIGVHWVLMTSCVLMVSIFSVNQLVGNKWPMNMFINWNKMLLTVLDGLKAPGLL